MFKIVRVTAPKSLVNTSKELTEELNKIVLNKDEEGMISLEKKQYDYYKKHDTSFPYNTIDTKKSFKKMNFKRCSICTIYIAKFNKELTVEHIQTKRAKPYLICEWENLLCSCLSCNRQRGTKEYNSELYLDPTKVDNIKKYFEYKVNGKIVSAKGLDEKDMRKAHYMIDLYNLNNEDYINERRDYYKSLIELEKTNKIELLKKYIDNLQELKHDVLYLNIFTYYIERIK